MIRNTRRSAKINHYCQHCDNHFIDKITYKQHFKKGLCKLTEKQHDDFVKGMCG